MFDNIDIKSPHNVYLFTIRHANDTYTCKAWLLVLDVMLGHLNHRRSCLPTFFLLLDCLSIGMRSPIGWHERIDPWVEQKQWSIQVCEDYEKEVSRICSTGYIFLSRFLYILCIWSWLLRLSTHVRPFAYRSEQQTPACIPTSSMCSFKCCGYHSVIFDYSCVCFFQCGFCANANILYSRYTGTSPSNTTVHQEYSINSLSAPVTSVSTEISESPARKKYYEAEYREGDRNIKKVNRGTSTRIATSSGSASSLRRSSRRYSWIELSMLCLFELLGDTLGSFVVQFGSIWTTFQ